VERSDRSPVTTFVVGEPLSTGQVALDEAAAHHARVKRLELQARIQLVDGAGGRAEGRVVRLGKRDMLVEIDNMQSENAPPPVHMIVPVADKDRMLWLAEKVAELAASSWRPVMWRRSRSVSPRGEGMTFQGKVRARMTSALAQSGGAWMPLIFPEATVAAAISAAPPGTRLLLDASGDAIFSQGFSSPVTIALGPEGGIEEDERQQFVDAGFLPVSLAATVLRFETAGVAALAVARAALMTTEQPTTRVER
jgi:16S rRNA (uracil1498-N3)-methyltransferase